MKDYSMLTTDQKIALGNAIEQRNPYSFLNVTDPGRQGMMLSMDWTNQIQENAYAHSIVAFRRSDLSIVKVVRIPYTYQDAHGNVIQEHVLIAYEGSAGE
jgi:uncharacterized protein (DUF1015 family)